MQPCPALPAAAATSAAGVAAATSAAGAAAAGAAAAGAAEAATTITTGVAAGAAATAATAATDTAGAATTAAGGCSMVASAAGTAAAAAVTAGGYRGRLAPSPTGYLHMGHAKTFWWAYQRARAAGGKLVMRNDDLDYSRVKPEFVQGFVDDLRWFGIDWDEGPDVGGSHGPYSQSERSHLYRRAFEKLREGGFVFPCTCSRRDIMAALSAPHQVTEEPVYPGTCRSNSPWSYTFGPAADPGEAAAGLKEAAAKVAAAEGKVAAAEVAGSAAVGGAAATAAAAAGAVAAKATAASAAAAGGADSVAGAAGAAVGTVPTAAIVGEVMAATVREATAAAVGEVTAAAVTAVTAAAAAKVDGRAEGAGSKRHVKPQGVSGPQPKRRSPQQQQQQQVTWRFRVPDGEAITFIDGHFGPQTLVAGKDFGDFQVWRGDTPSYQLACAVDDAEMGITEVVRGADLITSTARQLLILRALGYPEPSYFHTPLVLDDNGVRLAKRSDALSLRTLKSQGAIPEALREGWVEPAQWQGEGGSSEGVMP